MRDVKYYMLLTLSLTSRNISQVRRAILKRLWIKQMVTCGLFLDFSKAFYSMNHDILLSKLYHYGVRGTPFDWFKVTYRKERSNFSQKNFFGYLLKQVRDAGFNENGSSKS